MVDTFQLDANASFLAMEPEHGKKIESNTRAHSVTNLSIPRKILSPSSSSSSSSSSSTSSSRDSFHLGANTTVKSSTGTPQLDEENVIGPLERSSHQATILVTEPVHGSKTVTDLMAYPATNLYIPTKKLGPSSSSSSSASESLPQDTFELGADTTSATNIFKLDKNNEIGPLLPSPSSENPLETSVSATNKSSAGSTRGPQRTTQFSKEEIPVSSMPKIKQSSNELITSLTEKSATQFPPMQVMDRTGDSAASAPYRIPSYVFARTKSTAPMEWSLNSNESLFSIHMGNMSFTREQLYWVSKSGELEKSAAAGEVAAISAAAAAAAPPLIDLSTNLQLPPTNKSSEKMPTLDEGSEVITEGTAAATMMEVIKENEEDRSKQCEGASHSASISDGSTKSFAFPILTGDGDHKSGSLRMSSGKPKKQSKSSQLSRHLSQPQTPKEPPNEARTTSKAGPYSAHSRWLSCFSCCPFCSLGH